MPVSRIVHATLLGGLLLAMGWQHVTAQTPPAIPSSIWGHVTLNNEPAPAGQPVSAWINGVRYAHTSAFSDQGTTYYLLDVPADDPGTDAVEGGVPGDSVTLMVGTLAVSNAPWQSGSTVQRNLDAQTACTAAGGGDVDCDCDVDIGDMTAIASTWQLVSGQPGYQPRHDQNLSGVIELSDLAFAASHWSRRCP